MLELANRACVSATSGLVRVSSGVAARRDSPVRLDRWVVVVVIAIALVLAVGLAAAWWITCQVRGMYPALDMPSFQNGGTWVAYCRI